MLWSTVRTIPFKAAPRNVMVDPLFILCLLRLSPQVSYGQTHPCQYAFVALRNIMVGPTSVCIFSPQEQYGRTHSCSHLIPSRTVWSDPLLFASYPLKNSMVRPTPVRISSPQEHYGRRPLPSKNTMADPPLSGMLWLIRSFASLCSIVALSWLYSAWSGTVSA